MNKTSISWCLGPDGAPGMKVVPVGKVADAECSPEKLKGRVRSRASYWHSRKAVLDARGPDPITLLTAEERAYIAGIVDGEGTIYIAHNRKTMYPMLSVAMTHRGVIEWLSAKIRTPVIGLNNHTALRRHPNWRPQWIFRMQGRRAQLLCAVLRPYMRVKAEHADLVATYPIDARIAAGVKIESTDINRAREEIRLKIKKLNRRGIAALED